jgi:hypothetical protein
MSRGDYSTTVQMRIRNHTIIGLQLIDAANGYPELAQILLMHTVRINAANERYRLFSIAQCVVFRLRGDREAITNMERISAHKTRTTRRHYM